MTLYARIVAFSGGSRSGLRQQRLHLPLAGSGIMVRASQSVGITALHSPVSQAGNRY